MSVNIENLRATASAIRSATDYCNGSRSPRACSSIPRRSPSPRPCTRWPKWAFIGTGYSSFGYLKHFPFNRIKIDPSFVRDIGAEANAEAIVKAIIALGRSLGKSVTAEGVETERQLAFLRHHTCDEAQGYLLARPTSARAFTSHAAFSHEPVDEVHRL